MFKIPTTRIARCCALVVGLASLGACEGKPGPVSVSEDATDVPMVGLSEDERAQFDRGDNLIEIAFRDVDGLGPLFIETSCRSCHGADSRGPGNTPRMAIADANGNTLPDEAQVLRFGTTVRRHTDAGATTPILPPDASTPGLLLSVRFGPALFARGRVESISDEALLAQEALEASEGRVAGKANRLPDGTIGRFGVKARVATLDEFVADAFHGDMGLTSSRFPTELPNPDGLTDDLKPGIDLLDSTVTDIAAYVRTLAMPQRTGLVEAGYEVMLETGCLDCHVNTYQTRTDTSIAALSGIAADLYSDLLLHDLGTSDADGITDDSASGRQWKTAPLVGLRFFKSYLHDGRAKTLDDAIRAHAGVGSEANSSVTRYEALSDTSRQVLLDQLERL